MLDRTGGFCHSKSPCLSMYLVNFILPSVLPSDLVIVAIFSKPVDIIFVLCYNSVTICKKEVTKWLKKNMY